MIEGVAFAIGGEDLIFLELVSPALRQLNGHPTGQRHVDLTRAQGLCRVVDRHQRGRTGGLQVDRRAFEVKHVADARRKEIFIVAGMPQQEHAHIIDQIGVRADVEIEIAAHAAARVDADRAGEVFGHMPRLLHRLPSDLKKLAVLRV